jgi:hypothetical protein
VTIALDVGRQRGDGLTLEAPSLLTLKASAGIVHSVDRRLTRQRPRWRSFIPWILAATLMAVGIVLTIMCAAVAAYALFANVSETPS